MKDLLYHFLVGAAIALVILFISNGSNLGVVLACFGSLGAGIFKEIVIDKWWRKGTPDPADITFTWAGGILAIMLFKTIQYYCF